jgi:hypothetical protein
MLIRHLRLPHGRPVGTLVLTEDGNFGLSVCHPNDQFDNQLGITIATGRAGLNPLLDSSMVPNRRFPVSSYVDGDKLVVNYVVLGKMVRHTMIQMELEMKRNKERRLTSAS